MISLLTTQLIKTYLPYFLTSLTIKSLLEWLTQWHRIVYISFLSLLDSFHNIYMCYQQLNLNYQRALKISSLNGVSVLKSFYFIAMEIKKQTKVIHLLKSSPITLI